MHNGIVKGGVPGGRRAKGGGEGKHLSGEERLHFLQRGSKMEEIRHLWPIEPEGLGGQWPVMAWKGWQGITSQVDREIAKASSMGANSEREGSREQENARTARGGNDANEGGNTELELRKRESRRCSTPATSAARHSLHRHSAAFPSMRPFAPAGGSARIRGNRGDGRR